MRRICALSGALAQDSHVRCGRGDDRARLVLQFALDPHVARIGRVGESEARTDADVEAAVEHSGEQLVRPAEDLARFGTKAVALWGMLLFSISTLLCGMAQSLEVLVIWRIVLYYFNIALGILSSLIIVRREARNCT